MRGLGFLGRHSGALPAPGPRLRQVAPPNTLACPGCKRRYGLTRYRSLLRVCSSCGAHGRVPARERIGQLADPGSAAVIEMDLGFRDPLHFDDGVPYGERLRAVTAASGESEAMLVARATVGGRPVVITSMEFAFFGGSLGSAAGEAFARGCDLAVAESRALVAVCTSGGARMQEGIASLAQMARCSSGVVGVSNAGLPYLSVLTDPCFGGVTASFAVQADAIVAEPLSRIGFAGGRVIQQAAHETLPEGFQTAEFLLAHGMIDAVVERGALRPLLARLLEAYTARSRAS